MSNIDPVEIVDEIESETQDVSELSIKLVIYIVEISVSEHEC